MSSDAILQIVDLGKTYYMYSSPAARLVHLLTGRRQNGKAFEALGHVNLEMKRGESLGVIGRNGAGKSTFLQLLCGTISPTCGSVHTRGRIAPILELGAGFNPDFTGRENVFMSGIILGLERRAIEERLMEIINFADIGVFIDQPVRYYSSGMYVRLAFAIATSIDPDILVIDEAISVGDGAFAKKSFDRIMQLRRKGVTLLFCSHALYQVEALCDRVLWLDCGKVRALGSSAETVSAYNDWLANQEGVSNRIEAVGMGQRPAGFVAPSEAKILEVQVLCNGLLGRELNVRSGHSCIELMVRFQSDPQQAAPTVAIIIHNQAGFDIASTSTFIDQVPIVRNAQGVGKVRLTYEAFALLKGQFYFTVFLMGEEGVHVYDVVERCAQLNVSQDHLEVGLVSLPHQWSSE